MSARYNLSAAAATRSSPEEPLPEEPELELRLGVAIDDEEQNS